MLERENRAFLPGRDEGSGKEFANCVILLLELSRRNSESECTSIASQSRELSKAAAGDLA